MPEPDNNQLDQPVHYENQLFDQPYRETSINIQRSIHFHPEASYPLIELEFYKIEKGDNPITRYTWEIFILTAGYSVLLLAKFIVKAKIESWEPVALVIAFILFIALQFAINNFLPSDHKKVLGDIRKFFDENRTPLETHPQNDEH